MYRYLLSILESDNLGRMFIKYALGSLVFAIITGLMFSAKNYTGIIMASLLGALLGGLGGFLGHQLMVIILRIGIMKISGMGSALDNFGINMIKATILNRLLLTPILMSTPNFLGIILGVLFSYDLV